MSRNQVAIDRLLAATLRGVLVGNGDRLVASADPALILERITYHGIAGLLRDAPEAMAGWPAALVKHVSEEALIQTMWELRHRQVLNALLGRLAAASVVAIVLKGTAVAYDLYTVPGTRPRGDSDLLIDPDDLAATRFVLEQLGFDRTSGSGDHADAFALQEMWSQICDGGMVHHVDLHWQTLNCPALKDVLPVAECLTHRMALPRLGPDALGMDRVRTLIHTSIHRMLNFSSPYYVGQQAYFGGDRLIWLHDINLLARAQSNAEWDDFVGLAVGTGVAEACLNGLLAAQRHFATPIPAAARDALGAASTASRPAAYLRARQLGRAWRDLEAFPRFRRKISYLRARALPSGAFVRGKYPRQAGLPLPLLYARRLFEFFRARVTQGSKP